jgi:hypothetical protein
MKRRLFTGLLLGAFSLVTMAQVSSTLSPYSQFGLGVLSDQSQGFNRGMGGLAVGLRDGKIVNMQNPASYSAVDSLTMIFDAGVSGQITNFKEGGRRVNAKTATFDYAVTAFRLLPKVGCSFGVVPYSNIGYSYYDAEYNNYYQTSTDTYYNETYTGDGGFSQAYVGIGWEVLKGLSVGFNVSYFWGKYTKTITIANSDAYVNTLSKTYSASINSYKLDFGVQYQQVLNKDNVLTVGATVGLGHKLGADAKLISTNYDNVNALSYSTSDSVPDAFKLPLSIGVGATLLHKNSLTVGVDYNFQKWANIDYPMQGDVLKDASGNVIDGHKLGYRLVGGQLLDRHKFTLGTDWIPNPMSRNYFSHVHYRFGVSYATPYYNVNGVKGPREFSVSAGFGIPLVNSWNNRSTLNISAQWVNRSADNLIRENTFRINIGLTFNERWFAKWKVD